MSYWQSQGGLSQFGYPISDEFFEGYQVVQYFERARFEYHQEFVNTNYQVELALLGNQTLERSGRSFPPVAPPTTFDPTVFYFKETGHTLQGAFLTYWQSHGGVAVFGFPKSEPLQEVSPTDGKTYIVQYFERNRFELHPELIGSPYYVELGLLGSEALKLRPAPTNATAQVTIDTTNVISPAGQIIGANIESLQYKLPTETLHPDWNQTNPTSILEQTKMLTPTTGGHTFALSFGTQFDGGRMTGVRAGGADGYHWQRAFESGYGFMNLDEVAGLARNLSADLTVMVNFGSAKADEAANEVAYANGTDPTNPGVQLRQKRGYSTPYNITRWRIGGEVFDAGETGFSTTGDYSYANSQSKNGGDPVWFGKPTSDPANYAARAASFARAMRAASPTPIKIYLTLSVPGSNWGSIRDQLKTLIDGAGSDIDGFVMSLYPVSEGARSGLTDLDILGAPDRAAQWLQEAQTDLANQSPNKHYELITTEYNASIHSISQLDNLAGGLNIATMLAYFANLGVNFATHYSLETGTYGLYYYNADNSIGTPRPSWQALALFSNHLGSQMVSALVQNSPILHGPGGTLVPGFEYPSLVTTSSQSADRKELYIVAINRNPNQSLAVQFNVKGVQTTLPQQIEVTMLNGQTLDSLNDASHLNQTGLVKAYFSPADSTHFTFEIPAHSVIAFTIAK